MDELISMTQGASFCGVHLVTLQRAVAKGELKSSKIGRRRLVSKGSLQKWISQQNRKGKFRKKQK